MEARGRYTEARYSLDGTLIVSFELDDITPEDLECLKGKDLVIDADECRKKHSLNANNYFWALCGKIAKATGSDKDTIYLRQLMRYGVYEYIEMRAEGVENIRSLFRYIEEEGNYFVNIDGAEIEYKCLLCYRGSSDYDSKEYSDLLNGTIEDCHDLGINTWNEEEIDALISNWNR